MFCAAQTRVAASHAGGADPTAMNSCSCAGAIYRTNSVDLRNSALGVALQRHRVFQRRKLMPSKFLIAGALALAVAVPASAQTTVTEYYVVQDVQTKRCTIVDKKPTTTTTVTVGNGIFKTRTEAETGMRSIKVCTTN
jgi:hypothetical protein